MIALAAFRDSAFFAAMEMQPAGPCKIKVLEKAPTVAFSVSDAGNALPAGQACTGLLSPQTQAHLLLSEVSMLAKVQALWTLLHICK